MSSTARQTSKDINKSNKSLQKSIKRFLDISISFITLVMLLPIFTILAILIVLEDGRPIFFRQKRSGLYNEFFEMYKFRSMKNKQVTTTSNSYNNVTWRNGVPDDFVFKTSTENNPNITHVGRFIRKYSLDELPQFINVLKGDMSIIGPRPEIVSITRYYNEHQKRRLDMKPGITGWAQVNGRSEMNHGDKIKYDLYYVNNYSLWLDIKIFFKTIIQVIIGKGSV